MKKKRKESWNLNFSESELGNLLKSPRSLTLKKGHSKAISKAESESFLHFMKMYICQVKKMTIWTTNKKVSYWTFWQLVWDFLISQRVKTIVEHLILVLSSFGINGSSCQNAQEAHKLGANDAFWQCNLLFLRNVILTVNFFFCEM